MHNFILNIHSPSNSYCYIFLFSLSLLLLGCKIPAKNNITTAPLTIKVENPIAISRDNETIALPIEGLKKAFPNTKISFLEIKDSKHNQNLVSQPIDYNDDGAIDAFLFQTDFDPKEIKYFEINLSQNIPDSSSVFAKFINKPEGLGDFCWENDYIG